MKKSAYKAKQSKQKDLHKAVAANRGHGKIMALIERGIK
jgi:hypothetical protein